MMKNHDASDRSQGAQNREGQRETSGPAASAVLPHLKFGVRPILLRGLQPRDPDGVSRDPVRERIIINEYLDALRTQRIPPPMTSRPYWELLGSLGQSFSPMKDDCRVCVCVPVHNEEKVLGRFLESYLGQTTDSWEINLLINGRRGYQPDKSEVIARGYRAAYARRGIALNIAAIEFDESFGFEGFARRLLSDVSLLRSLRREGGSQPLYIKLEDADNFGHDVNLLRAGIGQLDSEGHLDCIVHDLGHDPGLVSIHDGLLFDRYIGILTERKFFASLKDLSDEPAPLGEELAARHRKFRVLTNGCVTMASAESIALVGGAFEGVPRMCELIYGEKLSILRGSREDGGLRLSCDTIGRLHLGSYSDVRRNIRNLVIATQAGSLCFDPYSSYGEEQTEDSLRESDLLQELNGDVLGPYKRFSKLDLERTLWFCHMVLDYQTHLLRQFTGNPTMFRRALYRYCNFLNSEACQEKSLFVEDSEKVRIRDEELLLATIERLRSIYLDKASAVRSRRNLREGE